MMMTKENVEKIRKEVSELGTPEKACVNALTEEEDGLGEIESVDVYYRNDTLLLLVNLEENGGSYYGKNKTTGVEVRGDSVDGDSVGVSEIPKLLEALR